MDLARLQIAIDSGDIKLAQRELRRLEQQGGRTERQTEELSRTATRLGRNFKRAVIGVTAFGAALGATSLRFVKIASDAEETQSKFNVVFRGMERTMTRWAESFAADIGRARQDIKEWTASVGDTLKPMGLTTQVAADLSKQIVQLATDVASFNNKQDVQVINAFKSALTGEREQLKQFGIVIHEADVQQEAYRLGLARTGEEISKQAKAHATLSLLYQQTQDAQGDLSRTADSYANQLKRAQGWLKDLQQTIGEALLPVYTDIITETNKWVKANRELIQSKITEWVGKVAQGIRDIVKFIDQYGDLIKQLFVVATITFVTTKIIALAGAVSSLINIIGTGGLLGLIGAGNPVTLALYGLATIVGVTLFAAYQSANKQQEIFNTRLSRIGEGAKTTVGELKKLQKAMQDNPDAAKALFGKMGAQKINAPGLDISIVNDGDQGQSERAMQQRMADIKALSDEYQNFVDLQQRSQSTGFMISPAETQQRIYDNWANSAERLKLLLTDIQSITIGIGQQLSNTVGQTFIEIAGAGENTAERIRRAWTSAIESIASQIISRAFLFALASFIMPGGGGAALKLLSGGSGTNAARYIFGGFANGGVFQNGTLQKFTTGGVVDRPTLFPMASGAGLMGEAGPEAVMPLRRTPQGDLGVQSSGGMSDTQFSQLLAAIQDQKVKVAIDVQPRFQKEPFFDWFAEEQPQHQSRRVFAGRKS